MWLSEPVAEQMCGLERTQRKRDRSAGRPQVAAEIGVHARRQIDRESEMGRSHQSLQFADDVGRQRTSQARSEQSIDKDWPRWRVGKADNRAAPFGAHRGGSAFLCPAKGSDHDVIPALGQQARGDPGIAAIIAGTGEHQHRPPHRKARRLARHGCPGALHQFILWNPGGEHRFFRRTHRSGGDDGLTFNRNHLALLAPLPFIVAGKRKRSPPIATSI